MMKLIMNIWKIFQAFFSQLQKLRNNCNDLPSNNSSLRSSHIWFSYIHNFIIILSRVYNEPIQRPAPSWLVSLIGRALHQYRRGQGFKSHTSLNFFQAFFSQLHKLLCYYTMWLPILHRWQIMLTIYCCFFYLFIVSRTPRTEKFRP